METAFRWIGRILSVLSIAVLLLFVFGEEFAPSKITAVQWLAFAFFPIGISIGFILAWKFELIGSIITLGSLVCFYLVFIFLMNGSIPKGPWFLVFALPAVAFLAAGLLHNRRGHEPKLSSFA
ncbi:MAG: hypothetical protein R2684_09690 [Pyrinomonadaceae bacterium]